MEYAGFNRLRAGRIHLYCPHCGRKMSNVMRDVEDPRRATLAHVWCLRCSNGCKECGVTFFDSRGRRLREPWETKYE